MAETKRSGLILVYTGTGKGKTTAALGAALRAAGHGFRVRIFQFIKGAWKYGELASLEKLPTVEIRQMGLGMVKRHQDREPDLRKAREAWSEAEAAIRFHSCDLLILDEINLVLHYGFVPVRDVVEALRAKPDPLHVILTGRYAPEEILEAADTVTEMRAVKHHLEAGIRAQKGIEF